MEDNESVILLISIVCLTAIIITISLVAGFSTLDCSFNGGSIQLDVDMNQHYNGTTVNHVKIGNIDVKGMKCKIPLWLMSKVE